MDEAILDLFDWERKQLTFRDWLGLMWWRHHHYMRERLKKPLWST